MAVLKGSETAKNIQKAFEGESQARNRYTFFAEQAHNEGHEALEQLFERMAKNETMHAKLWFKLMHDGMGTSAANIQEAAFGEHEEWRSMYPGFAEIARKEGFEEVAKLFDQVANIERDHEKTFLNAFVQLQASLSHAKKEAVKPDAKPEPAKEMKPVFRCIFCGAVFDNRPDVCSVCGAIGSFEAGTAER